MPSAAPRGLSTGRACSPWSRCRRCRSRRSCSRISVSFSACGPLVRPPYAAGPAYAPVVEAMAGLYEPTRRPGEPPPVVVAGALGDNASALYALIGTLAALRQRERTGRGQHVDI